MRRAILSRLTRPCACTRRPILASTAATTISQSARFASDSPSITERIRRNLWGTDAPPGPNDPYKRIPSTGAKVVENSEIEIDPEYREALDARGLPIAGLEKLSDMWLIVPFAPKTETVLQTEDIHRALHRAVVEVFTLRLNGRSPVTEIGINTPTTPETATGDVEIVVTESGEVRVEFAGPEVEEAILNSLVPLAEEVEVEVEADIVAETEVVAETAEAAETAVEAEFMVESDEPRPQWLEQGLRGEGWVRLPISQEQVKFAIIKRVLQLTGQRIPDAVATQTNTVLDLLRHLITPPPPKKLADALVETELAELPNVKLFSSRIKPMDKERVIGRARPIEQVVDYTYEGIDKPQKAFKGHVVYR